MNSTLIELATELSKTSEEIIRLQSIREEADQKVNDARLVLEQEEKTRDDIISNIETINSKIESIQIQMRELLKPKENKIVKKEPDVVYDVSGTPTPIRRREKWEDTEDDDDHSSRTKYLNEIIKYSADEYTKVAMEWEKHKKVFDSKNVGVVELTHSCYIPRIYLSPDDALVVIKKKLTDEGFTDKLDNLNLVKRQDFGCYASYYLNGLTRTAKQYLIGRQRISYTDGYMLIAPPKKFVYTHS